MDNRRVFARRPCKLTATFTGDQGSCLGEIRDVSLGGLLVRVPSSFRQGESVYVSPQGDAPMEYEICWAVEAGPGFEMGLRYPYSVSGYWDSWAADLLAGTRPTHSEVLERRSQVRLECLLEGRLRVGTRDIVVDILDIGGGGALLEMDSEITDEGNLELTIETPVRVGNLPCKIARAWPGEPALYGLEFTELRERHKLAIVRLLDLLMRQAG